MARGTGGTAQARRSWKSEREDARALTLCVWSPPMVEGGFICSIEWMDVWMEYRMEACL